MTIYTPITYRGLEASVEQALKANKPTAVRYPSGSEDEIVVNRFYSGGNFDNIGLKTDFDKNADVRAVIVTYGRIVKEAIVAQNMLKEKGIKVGIILLEMLKPYSISAELIRNALSDSVQAVLFLEEEIRSGGAGMNLTDKLSAHFEEQKINHGILAVDDDFIEFGEQGKSIYESAGIDAGSIKDKILEMI